MSYKILTVAAVYALALAGVTSIGVVSSSTTAQAAPTEPQCKKMHAKNVSFRTPSMVTGYRSSTKNVGDIY